MEKVTIRELRNQGATVLARVERGESLIVTRDGAAVAELMPTRRPSPRGADLIARRKNFPEVDVDQFRQDVDSLADASL